MYRETWKQGPCSWKLALSILLTDGGEERGAGQCALSPIRPPRCNFDANVRRKLAHNEDPPCLEKRGTCRYVKQLMRFFLRGAVANCIYISSTTCGSLRGKGDRLGQRVSPPPAPPSVPSLCPLSALSLSLSLSSLSLVTHVSTGPASHQYAVLAT